MNGRAVGVARMQHQRHAQCLPGLARELRAARRGRGRELAALDVREVDAAALEETSVLDHAREPAAAFGALPFVGLERVSVRRFKARDDLFLQGEEVVADGAGVHVRCA